MNVRTTALSLTLGATLAAHAAEGLVAPAADTLWPQWQARITVQAVTLSALPGTRLLDLAAAQRGVQGAAVLGDYYFATPAFGSFRASGGLMVGAQGGTPLASALAGARLGLAVNSGGGLSYRAANEAPGTVPYLGVGFTGAPWRSGLQITADLGMVAEHPGAAAGVGRALFGSQTLDGALREMRLSPVLQLGVRYAF
jgi:hypothetical protein